MKSTKTPRVFTPPNETILMSEELISRVKTDDVRSHLLGFDEQQDDLCLITRDRSFIILELFLDKKNIVIEADVYLLYDILKDDTTLNASLAIKGKVIANYQLTVTSVKNLYNGKFNYTFKIIKNEVRKQCQ